MSTPLADSAIKRQVQLERLKASFVKDYNATYDEISAVIAAALALLETDLSKMGIRARSKWLNNLTKEVKSIFTKRSSEHDNIARRSICS